MNQHAWVELLDLKLVTQIGSYGPADGLYETQERLMTRIAYTCVHYPEIKAIEMKLKKTPVRSDHGSLGIRLSLDEIATSALRSNAVLEN